MPDLISFLNPVSPYDQSETDGWDQAARNMGWTGAGAGALAGVLGLSDIARTQLAGARYFHAMQRAAEIEAAKRANAELANVVRTQMLGLEYGQRPRATGPFGTTFTRQNTIPFLDASQRIEGPYLQTPEINRSPISMPVHGPLGRPAFSVSDGDSARKRLRHQAARVSDYSAHVRDYTRDYHNNIVNQFSNQPKPVAPRSKAKAATAAHQANMARWLENQRLVEESKKWLADNPDVAHLQAALKSTQRQSQQPQTAPATPIQESGRIQTLRAEAKAAAGKIDPEATRRSALGTLSETRQGLVEGSPTVTPAPTPYGQRAQAAGLLRDIEKAGKEKLNPRPARGSGFLDVVGGWENVKSTAQKANQKLGKIGKVASIASIPVGAAGAAVTQWIAENRAKQEQAKQKPAAPATPAAAPTQRATISRQEFGKRVQAYITAKGLDSSNLRTVGPQIMIADFKKMGGSDKDIADMIKFIYGQATKK